jgi:anion-transporting  ArsA/GET3 family ATPase
MKRLWKLNNNYESLNRILQGENCSIVLVFNPDILSLKESQRLMEGLNDLNLPLRLLINNKVSEENKEMANYVEENMRKMAKDVPIDRVSLSKTLLDDKDGRLYDIQEDITLKLF